MHILLTNDDGIDAPGIRCLAERLTDIATVTVVAPDRNCSGMSHALTLQKPLRAHHRAIDQIAIEGTPVDCVHLALTGLIEKPFDCVVSGINNGCNLGIDVLYSGTVGAAIEGAIMGLPALAVSLEKGPVMDYQVAADVTVHCLKHLDFKAKKPSVLNINVPNVPKEKLNGIKVVSLGETGSPQPMVRGEDPRGKPLYWIGAAGQSASSCQQSDYAALAAGFAALTPLQPQWTDTDGLEAWSSVFSTHPFKG